MSEVRASRQKGGKLGRMLEWLKRLFGIAEVVTYLFRCIVCALEETLSVADARERGWRYNKGWRCKRCR